MLKQRHPNLKTQISVGGWTLSDDFSAAAATASARQTFAQSCVAFMKQWGFDGIDIDWEYPVTGGLHPVNHPDDKHNFTLLLQALRAALDSQAALDSTPVHPVHYLLTIDGPAGYDKIANIEPAAIANTVDWINVISYDYHGSWEPTTNFVAPLCSTAHDPDLAVTGGKYNIDYTIKGYEHNGVPPTKLLLGEPMVVTAASDQLLVKS